MAVLQGGPIATAERSIPEGTPLPPGIYHAIVVKTNQKETSTGGIMLEVEFDITHPEIFKSSGRKFWENFNIVNANATAAKIGQEHLADLGIACGYSILEDDEQLIGQEVIARLAVEEAKPYIDKQGVQRTGKAKNKCLKYWPIGTNVEEVEKASKGSQSSSPQAATQQQAVVKPAWQTTSKPVAQPQAQAAAPATVQVQGAVKKAPWK